MSALAFTIVVYGVGLTGALGWLVLSGGRRGPRTAAAVGLVQVATTGLAVTDAVATLPDLSGSAAVTHGAYLMTSVVVLPLSFSVAGSDRGRWGNAAMAVAMLMLVVVVVRVRQTADA